MSSEQVVRQLARVAGGRRRAALGADTAAGKEWTLEDLMTPGARGKARAAARFHRNKSAQRALAQLDAAVAELKRNPPDTGGAA